MERAKTNLLITGRPGVGKTTLIRKLVGELTPFDPAGFITEEIREMGERKGFKLESFDGKRGILAHTDFESRHRVGRYRVDVPGFERFLTSIALLRQSASLIIIDEIGKMECMSSGFIRLVEDLLDSNKLLIATVALTQGGVIGTIKKRGDVELIEVTRQNRDSLPREIVALVSLSVDRRK